MAIYVSFENVSYVQLSLWCCRQASIGPGALIAVLANVAVEGVVGTYDTDPDRYVAAMALLAFQTGFLQIVFGALGLGVLTSILSHPGEFIAVTIVFEFSCAATRCCLSLFLQSLVGRMHSVDVKVQYAVIEAYRLWFYVS